MKHVVVPALTVQRNGNGLYQQLFFSKTSGTGSDHGIEVDSQLDAQYSSQLAASAKVLQYLLRYLGTGNAGHALVEARPQTKLEGGSHGLCLVLGSLALHLDLPLNHDCAFSAQISSKQKSGTTIGLESVHGIIAKATAAGKEGVKRLYYHSRDGAEIESATEFMRARLRLDSAATCDLVPLRRSLSWQSLFNLSLDFEELWPRLNEEEHPLHEIRFDVALQLLAAAATRPAVPGEYPFGVGRFVAEARSSRNTELSQFNSLPLEAVRRVMDRSRGRDLIKLSISRNPSGTVEEDLKEWLTSDGKSPLPAPKYFPLPSLITILDISTSYLDVSKELRNKLLAIAQDRLATLEEELGDHDAPMQHAERVLSSISAMTGSNSELASAALKSIHNYAKTQDSIGDELTQELESLEESLQHAKHFARLPRESYLTLSFKQGLHDVKDKSVRLSELNDLSLTYSGPGLVSCTLTSPVLLLERTQSQSSYSRREGFCIADDPSTRIPPKDFSIIANNFAACPTRIEYECPSDEGAEPIGVFWNPAAVAFPPAIDAQFFARTLNTCLPSQGIHAATAKSLIDVGCGTGFLAAVAAHLLPALETITLLDQCEAGVKASVNSLDYACRLSGEETPFGSVASAARRISIVSSLESYNPEERFDVLVCNPPYLPMQHLASEGITAATNGTALLEEVLRRAAELAQMSFIACSTIAWPEVLRGLENSTQKLESIEIVSREFVPLRIPWIEPIPPEDYDELGEHRDHVSAVFNEKKDYYESILKVRGRDLIDLDEGLDETEVSNRSANSWIKCTPYLNLQDKSDLTPQEYSKKLTVLLDDSRGYRFWHEIRILRIRGKRTA